MQVKKEKNKRIPAEKGVNRTRTNQEEIKTAQWDLSPSRTLQKRQYIAPNGTIFSPEIRGANLPALDRVTKVEQSEEQMKALLASTQLYTNLPAPFYEQMIDILTKETNPPFPLIMQDKSPTVAACINKMVPEHQQKLGQNQWKELGWVSEQAYKQQWH